MSLLTVVFELRKRRVVSADDASPPNWIPQNWISQSYAFTLNSDEGLQENPGQVSVTSATRRHLVAFTPPGYIDTSNQPSWPTVLILGGSRKVGGVEVLTEPMAVGAHDLFGGLAPAADIYYTEGEEVADLGIWKGAPSGGPVVA